MNEITYNGKVYGEWDNEANIDSPEDLTLERDLSYLLHIGIEIGKQMKLDEINSIGGGFQGQVETDGLSGFRG
jgi:hypothetical protein